MAMAHPAVRRSSFDSCCHMQYVSLTCHMQYLSLTSEQIVSQCAVLQGMPSVSC